MTDLLTRVREALGGEWQADRSPWEGLIRLYEADREAFYLLACEGEQENPKIERLGLLARRVRKAVRSAYRLVPPSGGEGQVESMNDRLPVPADLFPRVQRFLLEVDGKGVSETKGKDYQGRAISEAEVRFKLGEPTDAAGHREKLDVREKTGPVVLKLAQHDLDSLKDQPAYVTHNLLKCARKVVLAPTAVYRGLMRGEHAPKRLREGWAICGRPNRACDNDGHLIPTPPGMVFMVYADAEGYVFDWDWVQEAAEAPGHPLDPELRFGELQAEAPEMVLDIPSRMDDVKFDSTVATYSDRGDCIFCYICDECGYAERINPDLTIFRSCDTKEVTGFKIKNVRRILKDEEDFVSDDAPDLTVSVQAILLATLRANRQTSVRIYELIIEAFRKVEHPPEVHLPSHEIDETELAGA